MALSPQESERWQKGSETGFRREARRLANARARAAGFIKVQILNARGLIVEAWDVQDR